MTDETELPSAENRRDIPDVRPGELRLHPDRPAVTRLSRKVLVGLGGVAAIGVAGALFFALRPHVKAPEQELLNTGNHSLPEGLSKLSQAHVADAPKLGPALPGDLGKPMLNAGVSPSSMSTPTAQSPEQQRLAQEQNAAQTSHLFAPTNMPPASGAMPNAPAILSSQPSAAVQTTSDPTGTENMQDKKLAFAGAATTTAMVSPARVQKPASRYVIQAGWVINVALAKGMNSDLPGDVRGQVTESVYDSPTGRYLLIPQGSTLQGKYNSQVSFGQRRMQILWTRLTFPNGNWINLGNLPGADSQGYAGIEDGVDEHWGTLFKAVVLSTVLSVGAEAGTSNSENNLAQAIREGASQSVNQAGQQIVARNLNVQPTLTGRVGLPVTVSVDQDLVLEPYVEKAQQ